ASKYWIPPPIVRSGIPRRLPDCPDRGRGVGDRGARRFIKDRFQFMARGNFGERLKREREIREVSLDELTKATRISARFVEALENEDWAKLPGGVFGHGFVRTIARYLGLNEEALLGEYDSARAERSLPMPPKPAAPIPPPPKWIPAAAALIGLLLLVACFYIARYAWHHLADYRAAKQAAVSIASSPNVPLELTVSATA